MQAVKPIVSLSLKKLEKLIKTNIFQAKCKHSISQHYSDGNKINRIQKIKTKNYSENH